MVPESDLDLSGVLSIDFVNTVRSIRATPMDLLAEPDDFVSWMALAGGDELARLAPSSWPERRTLTREARALRAALRDLFTAVAARESPSRASTFVVDRALGAAAVSFSLASGSVSGTGRRRDAAALLAATVGGSDVRGAGPELMRTFEGGSPLAALTPIALSAMEITAVADPDRLRSCDAPGCARWFMDTSRGGQRRWCSMERCGNRMKAARYRARQAERS